MLVNMIPTRLTLPVKYRKHQATWKYAGWVLLLYVAYKHEQLERTHIQVLKFSSDNPYPLAPTTISPTENRIMIPNRGWHFAMSHCNNNSFCPLSTYVVWLGIRSDKTRNEMLPLFHESSLPNAATKVIAATESPFSWWGFDRELTVKLNAYSKKSSVKLLIKRITKLTRSVVMCCIVIWCSN